ncbi:hypothetical protein GCM10008956_24300 [Deinococcus arenae]|uniref:TIGR04222 domain-containing membrane protein n=1 Tax=Deinococcus arenae TaxID=1452751 RepID=A0A8H9GQR3_9DEIO|nr:hypothetical protein [Deinococcus arenae]AWT34886.1 hypothetical protein DM785_04405 [Deinococcus actinosclerus]GGM47226.1 hypothetical protein GCM10008956_24300 [Deinococcus arenae]
MSHERTSGQPSVIPNLPVLPTLPPLWDELRAYALPGGLLTRLGREQRWTPAFTQRAAQEYRRFLLLSTLGAPVTPPAVVDEVWHLHLLFTRDYWARLTPLLPAPLHHEPGGGQAGDPARFRAQYEATLDAYARTFGERPPSDIWPDPRRAPRPQREHVQGSARRSGLWLALVVAVVTGLTFAWSHAALPLAVGAGLVALLLVNLTPPAARPAGPARRADRDLGAGWAASWAGSESGGSGSGDCPPGSDSSGLDGGGDSGGSSCGSSCGGGCSS